MNFDHLLNPIWRDEHSIGLRMRLLVALFTLVITSGCAFVLRDDHFNPSSDHGKPAEAHRRVPPKERIFLTGENYRLEVHALAVTSEVAWFGPLIPIFPGVLLGGLDKDVRDEPLTIVIWVGKSYGKSLSINLDEVSVHRNFDSKPLRPSIVERECFVKGARSGKYALQPVSGKQTLNDERRSIDGTSCFDSFHLRYEIKRRDIESFEVHFGEVVVDGVSSTPEPIRFKRAVDHWLFSVP